MLHARPRTLLVSLLAGLISAVMLAASVGAQAPITINLGAQNNSGITGTATLTPMGNQTRVTLNLQGTPAGGAHPAHIHMGTCANLTAAPRFPLTNVQNGTSETTVNASIDQIRAEAHAINVHKSAQEASVYVACGNLPTGGAAAPAGMPRTGAGGGTGLPTETILGLGSLMLLAVGGFAMVARRRAV